MNIELSKTKIIQDLIQCEDDWVISAIEKLLHDEKISVLSNNIFSVEMPEKNTTSAIADTQVLTPKNVTTQRLTMPKSKPKEPENYDHMSVDEFMEMMRSEMDPIK